MWGGEIREGGAIEKEREESKGSRKKKGGYIIKLGEWKWIENGRKWKAKIRLYLHLYIFKYNKESRLCFLAIKREPRTALSSALFVSGGGGGGGGRGRGGGMGGGGRGRGYRDNTVIGQTVRIAKGPFKGMIVVLYQP